MKVSELVSQLDAFNPDAEVEIALDTRFSSILEVEQSGHKYVIIRTD